MAGLNDFLEDEPQAAVAPELPAPEPAPEPAAVAIPEGGEPAEDDSHASMDGRVPIGVVSAIRKERNDYKGERDTLKGRLAALEAELEAARKAPVASPAPPPVVQAPPPQAMPNPVEDPAAYATYVQQQQDERLLHQALNLSEDALRDKEGDDAVDKAVAKFKDMRAADPTLQARFLGHRNPYKWMFAEVKRVERLAEIEAPDWEAKKEAEIEARVRAKLVEEYGGTPAQPAVVLPRSLATERSAAPRGAQAEVVPEFEDIFKRPKRRT